MAKININILFMLMLKGPKSIAGIIPSGLKRLYVIGVVKDLLNKSLTKDELKNLLGYKDESKCIDPDVAYDVCNMVKASSIWNDEFIKTLKEDLKNKDIEDLVNKITDELPDKLQYLDALEKDDVYYLASMST